MADILLIGILILALRRSGETPQIAFTGFADLVRRHYSKLEFCLRS